MPKAGQGKPDPRTLSGSRRNGKPAHRPVGTGHPIGPSIPKPPKPYDPENPPLNYKGEPLPKKVAKLVPANRNGVFADDAYIEHYKNHPDRLATKNPAKDKQMREFARVIETDNGAFEEACRMQPTNSKFFSLIIMLLAPEWQNITLAAKCRKLDLSLRELKEFYVQAQKDFGTIRMMEKLPDIMAQTAEEALQQEVVCNRCDGKLTVEDEVRTEKEHVAGQDPEYEITTQVRTCPKCDGSGKMRIAGDKESKETVFKIAGLIDQGGKGGVTVPINFNMVQPVESTVSDIGRILEMKPVNAT